MKDDSSVFHDMPTGSKVGFCKSIRALGIAGGNDSGNRGFPPNDLQNRLYIRPAIIYLTPFFSARAFPDRPANPPKSGDLEDRRAMAGIFHFPMRNNPEFVCHKWQPRCTMAETPASVRTNSCTCHCGGQIPWDNRDIFQA